jgi:hypothetical protein
MGRPRRSSREKAKMSEVRGWRLEAKDKRRGLIQLKSCIHRRVAEDAEWVFLFTFC